MANKRPQLSQAAADAEEAKKARKKRLVLSLEQRATLLAYANQHRHNLFDPISSKVTKAMQAESWVSFLDFCWTQKCEFHDESHFMDNFNNWKTRARQLRQDREKSGNSSIPPEP